MSVNGAQTILPVLYLPAGEPVPRREILTAFRAIVIAGSETGLPPSDLPRQDAGCLLLARIETSSDPGEDELAALIGSGFDGVVLAGCRGPADIQRLDVLLKVAEAAAGKPQGRTVILAEYATTPESVLSPHSLAGASSRLSALVFDASALAEACGCRRVTETGDVPAVVRAGRAAAVLRACEARIAAYDMLPIDAEDEATVRRLWKNSVENGFSSVALRSPQQIDLLAAAGVVPEV
ncbi:aldolase/citrate lyase family protein [Sinorhizobium meliloti]|uniref:aldolase/citrate lyase family protein n=1 Tax=Rhizobium meliloti TaxID=382 RepID=UPI00030E2FD4|nr:aldolase/citrate lyase family protein [Sinorhizobium meliloti]MDE4601134.1 aldolase/citrate lyase family protein [Sinorhizobium meliloti]QQF05819.1 aldolase [Sinorhizobium meliloti]UDU20741.1 aldolase [Sinorhizobium meliloti]